MIDLTQLAVAGYLYSIAECTYAYILIALILPQMVTTHIHKNYCLLHLWEMSWFVDPFIFPTQYFQYKYFLPDPVANDVKYQAAAQVRSLYL